MCHQNSEFNVQKYHVNQWIFHVSEIIFLSTPYLHQTFFFSFELFIGEKFVLGHFEFSSCEYYSKRKSCEWSLPLFAQVFKVAHVGRLHREQGIWEIILLFLCKTKSGYNLYLNHENFIFIKDLNIRSKLPLIDISIQTYSYLLIYCSFLLFCL